MAAHPIPRDAIVRAAPWVALLVIGCLMDAVAVHQLLNAGACSSTGYTRYGPAPECPSGTGWYAALVPVGLVLAICSGASERSPVQGWHFFAGLFGAIGVGALTSDAPTAFRLIFDADRIVVVEHGEDARDYGEDGDLPAQARERFGLPVEVATVSR